MSAWSLWGGVHVGAGRQQRFSVFPNELTASSDTLSVCPLPARPHMGVLRPVPCPRTLLGPGYLLTPIYLPASQHAPGGERELLWVSAVALQQHDRQHCPKCPLCQLPQVPAVPMRAKSLSAGMTRQLSGFVCNKCNRLSPVDVKAADQGGQKEAWGLYPEPGAAFVLAG